MTWVGFLLLLFGLSTCCVGIFRWYAIDQGMLDEPNARSSHIAPTPRGAGVVFFLGWVLLMGVLNYYGYVRIDFLWLFSPAILVGLVGFWDDHHDLSASSRFVVQCLAAALFLWVANQGGDFIHDIFPKIPLPACFLILVIGIVWMTNLFNFMDGSDGIAATQGMFVFGVGGYLLYEVQAYDMLILAWGLVALLAGFLTWNWPIARVFMGDSGSYFLGFTIALYALISYQIYQIPLMIWAILTGVFWFDATVTLLRRLLAGEEWRKPHRSHAYQRMIQYGWSHRKVLLATICVNAVIGMLAILAFRDPRLLNLCFGATVCLLAVLYLAVEIAKPMFITWHGRKPA